MTQHKQKESFKVEIVVGQCCSTTSKRQTLYHHVSFTNQAIWICRFVETAAIALSNAAAMPAAAA
jgi:hypothetical protein